MNRRIIAAGIIVLSAATFLLAGRQGSVVTSDGQRIEGEITETRETVTVIRNGVTSVLPKDQVAEIDYSTFAERFERTLDGLAKDDVDGRLKLAREAFDQREYELAQRAVDAAMEINPVSRPARDMSRAIANQLTLEATQRNPPPTPATRPDSSDEPPATRRRTRGLSADQINIVRQKELQAGDNVRIQFRNNVKKVYVDSQPGLTFREFNTLNDVAQGLQMIEHGSDDVRRDVVILNDPRSIRVFGQRIHTSILQGCATSQCHGGEGAGAFQLMTVRADPTMLITNFYLLNQFHRLSDSSDAIFAPRQESMVERSKARESLLYQYSLPRAKAKFKHPEVRNWDGLFMNETDRLAADLEKWMDHELIPVKPDYGFTFSLAPTTSPTTQPPEEPSEAASVSEPATQPTE